MLSKLHQMLFEPRYPQRYIGRHRATGGFAFPLVTISVRRRETD